MLYTGANITYLSSYLLIPLIIDSLSLDTILKMNCIY